MSSSARCRADPLTGCASQAVLVCRLEELTHRPDKTVAVVFADIDEFGVIHRRHGQDIHDKLLIAVGRRLTRLVRPGDTLARLDNNTFVVLVEDDNEVGTLDSLTARIDSAANGPFGIAGLRVTVASTVGISFTGRSRDVPGQILLQTDIAIHRAKDKKRAGADIDLTVMTRPDPVARSGLCTVSERTV